MTALESALPLPTVRGQLYLACPLTALRERARRQVKSDIATVHRAVERETRLDRVEEDAWPLSVYAPLTYTAPWNDDGLTPSEVYERNLGKIHESDALIVLAEEGGSVGVGQELEWAIQLRLPILFLAPEPRPSRQIVGSPAFIDVRIYNGDAETLEGHVRHFLQQWKPLILDGPARRESRRLRFEAVTTRLRVAWEKYPNRTDIAAQTRVDLRYLDVVLSDPSYVAVMPLDTLLTVAHHLGVPLHGIAPTPSFVLPITMLRPLMAAAAEDGWDDPTITRLLHEGRAAIQTGDVDDLMTLDGWRRRRGSL